MARSLEKTCGLLQNACNRGIVGRNERCEDLSHVTDTTPLVPGQQLDSALLDNGVKALSLDAEFELPELGLIEARQALDVEGGRKVAERKLGTLRNAIDGPDLLANDGRSGAKRDADVNEGFLNGIVDCESFDDCHIVLCGGEIDLLHHVVVQGHCPRGWLLVESSDIVVVVWQSVPPRLPDWRDIPNGEPACETHHQTHRSSA